MNQPATNHDENMRKAERIAYLIHGHVQDTLTPEERAELDDWVTESDENLELFEKLTDEDNIAMGVEKYLQIEKTKKVAYKGIKSKIGKNRKNTIWPWVVAVICKSRLNRSTQSIV